MSEQQPIAEDETRARIVAAAAGLIAAGGRDAATTRAVAAAARVQAPTIYRLFGDKRGLLDAVAEYEMAAYMAEKARRAPHPDPLQDLRDGWGPAHRVRPGAPRVVRDHERWSGAASGLGGGARGDRGAAPAGPEDRAGGAPAGQRGRGRSPCCTRWARARCCRCSRSRRTAATPGCRRRRARR
jgi:AcrR family transcriptional regulator